MIVDRRHTKWALTCAAIAAASLAAYAVAGAFLSLFFAALGTGVIVFECLLGLRKRYPASRLGRVKTWVSAHLWLGLLSFFLILLHAGFHWGHGLAAVLMWLFAVILVSGIFGVALQNYIPRRMTELVPHETIYEQIPTVIRGLRSEADERVEFITADLGMDEPDEEYVRAGGVKQYFDPAQKKSAGEKVQAVIEKRKSSPQIEVDEDSCNALRAHYLQEVRPYLHDQPAAASRNLFSAAPLVAAYFNHLRTIMPVAAHDVLRDLEGICEERRQLLVQRRLHLLLHGWLVVHVPLSFAFLVLTAVHSVISLRY
jgi:hypothetical protein